MPKVKTHSGAKKRFKVSANGKIRHRKANTSHLMRKKSKKTKRHLRIKGEVSKADKPNVKRLLNL